MSTNPTDAQGNAILGNTARLTEIAADFQDAHLTLARLPRTLRDYLELMSIGDDIPRTATTGAIAGCDGDIASAILEAAPPSYWARESANAAIQAIHRSAEKTGDYSTNIAGFAQQLQAADVTVSAELLGMAGTSLVSFGILDKFTYSTRDAYRSARLELQSFSMLDEDGNINDAYSHEGLQSFMTGPARSGWIFGKATDTIDGIFGVGPTFTWSRAANVTDLLQMFDACNPAAADQGIEPGTSESGSGDDSGDDSGDGNDIGSAAWFGRQMQDMFGVVPRDAAAIASWGGHMVADTGDFVWDAGWGVGKFAVNTVWDAGASMVHSNSIVTDIITGKVSPGEGLDNLWDQQWHDAKETLGNVGTFVKDEAGNIADWGESVAKDTWSGVKDIGGGLWDFVNPDD